VSSTTTHPATTTTGAKGATGSGPGGTTAGSRGAPTSTSPTARRLWSRARGLLIAAAVLALAGVALAALRSGQQHGLLDPRSPDGHGSRAVAALLADRDVHTHVVTSVHAAAAAAGPHTTVLVTRPDLLGTRKQRDLRDAADRGGRLLLLAPSESSVSTLAPGVHTDGLPVPVASTRPGCDLPAARRAGKAAMGGYGYSTPIARADTCYANGLQPTLVRVPSATGAGDTVVLGSPDLLYNDNLGKQGNASLALQLLGAHRNLVWYLPSAAEAAAQHHGKRSFSDLIPDGWHWALLQLFVAAALAALWRGRRLGRLVPERLPVAVRAAEATEGRARLYRAAGDRGHAARTLRAAARARLAALLGVPAAQAHRPDALLPALADHDADADVARLHELLFGSGPADDTALVRLADHLDAVEDRLRPGTATSTTPTAATTTDKDRPS
jgi:uncharacterized protein DUF4350